MVRTKWFKILGFLLLLFALDRLIHATLAAGFRRTEVGETGGMVNRARRVRADVVVTGSSRAWRHYDTGILGAALHSSVFNAGCDGQGFHYVRGIVDLLLHDYMPRLLIIDADPAFMVEAIKYRERVVVLAPFIDESDVIREMIYERGPLERLKYLSMAFRYNSKPLSILSNLGARDTSDHGFRPLDRVMQLSTSTDAAGIAAEPQSDEASVAVALETIEKTVRAAQSAGTRVILVTSPRYRPDFHDEPAYVGLFERIGRLASRLEVPYLRITQENAPEFRDASLFADVAHLNRRGAALFTETLATRLGEIGIDAKVVRSRPGGEGHSTARLIIADADGRRRNESGR